MSSNSSNKIKIKIEIIEEVVKVAVKGNHRDGELYRGTTVLVETVKGVKLGRLRLIIKCK